MSTRTRPRKKHSKKARKEVEDPQLMLFHAQYNNGIISEIPEQRDDGLGSEEPATEQIPPVAVTPPEPDEVVQMKEDEQRSRLAEWFDSKPLLNRFKKKIPLYRELQVLNPESGHHGVHAPVPQKSRDKDDETPFDNLTTHNLWNFFRRNQGQLLGKQMMQEILDLFRSDDVEKSEAPSDMKELNKAGSIFTARERREWARDQQVPIEEKGEIDIQRAPAPSFRHELTTSQWAVVADDPSFRAVQDYVGTKIKLVFAPTGHLHSSAEIKRLRKSVHFYRRKKLSGFFTDEVEQGQKTVHYRGLFQTTNAVILKSKPSTTHQGKVLVVFYKSKKISTYTKVAVAVAVPTAVTYFWGGPVFAMGRLLLAKFGWGTLTPWITGTLRRLGGVGMAGLASWAFDLLKNAFSDEERSPLVVLALLIERAEAFCKSENVRF